jgi:hypothetical protein
MIRFTFDQGSGKWGDAHIPTERYRCDNIEGVGRGERHPRGTVKNTLGICAGGDGEDVAEILVGPRDRAIIERRWSGGTAGRRWIGRGITVQHGITPGLLRSQQHCVPGEKGQSELCDAQEQE